MRNAYTVITLENGHVIPLFKGEQCECYNYMLWHPTAWSHIIYTKSGMRAPIRLAELRLQQAKNLANKSVYALRAQ